MGLHFSCPFADFDDLESYFEAILVRSIRLGGGDVRTELRSLSFKSRHLDPTAMKSYGSGKMLLEGSLSFKRRALNTTFSFNNSPNSDVENKVFVRSICQKTGETGDHLTVPDSFTKKNAGDKHMKSESFSKKTASSPLPESADRRHLAAVKLQKVYKSFRTRRQLADCAVVVEQKWWKLLDFAELKRSSISFFDIEKPESAFSRWSRARTKAAKLGKGLSKDSKARKLALQHWLEAIDPRHRYGHNLQFYYVKWLHCQSRQPFFYWLDIGEGKEVNLERCPRSKLQQQCIKYLGPTERQEYEVEVKNGKFFYKQSEKVVDTREGPKDTKWIFVLSTAKTLYVGKKNKGTFQHSSFLAGGATLSAGRLVIEDGILKAVWPHSGHYLPTEENFQEFMLFLAEHDIDVSKVQKSPDDGEEESFTLKSTGSTIRTNQSETDLARYREATNVENLARENLDLRQQDSHAVQSKLSLKLSSNITKLEIPTRYDVVNAFKREEVEPNYHPEPNSPVKDAEDGYASAEDTFLTEEDFMFPKYNLFDDEEEEDEEPIPEEKIMKRIDSHKVMKSYQLAQQLSSKWTTGAGPRIGCMRDYPSELQFRVLEHAHLSPRATSANSSPRIASRFSPRVSPPKVLMTTNDGTRNPPKFLEHAHLSPKMTSRHDKGVADLLPPFVSVPTSQCRETTCSNRSPLATGQVTDISS